MGILLSSRLTEGNIYTRDELAKLLESKDATINTGIFQPRDYDSILLFVTERKPGDMTQYADQLVGDTLSWQGQTAGRKDALIIAHGDYSGEGRVEWGVGEERLERIEERHPLFAQGGKIAAQACEGVSASI